MKAEALGVGTRHGFVLAIPMTQLQSKRTERRIWKVFPKRALILDVLHVAYRSFLKSPFHERIGEDEAGLWFLT